MSKVCSGFLGLSLIFMNLCGFLCIGYDSPIFVQICGYCLWFLGWCSGFLHIDLLISGGWSWFIWFGLDFYALFSWFLWFGLDVKYWSINFCEFAWISMHWSWSLSSFWFLQVVLDFFSLVLIFMNSSGFLCISHDF